MIAYCFHSVAGYSKIGSYTGNGSTNGPIVQTGFEPAFIMVKRTSNVSDWSIFDNKRNLTNPRDLVLAPNITDAERTYGPVTFLSNGFQQTNTNGGLNSNGDTFIYMAFAADPDTEAPTVAKSFAVQTYSGNGGTQSLDGFGFTPSMIWTKGRTVAYDHGLYDSVRGGGSLLYPSLNQAASTVTNGIQSFDADGVTFGANNKSNASDSTYVAWAWKADDNEPTINTEGSIDSLVSANANAGFSIVKWDGTGAINTVGHGLSAAPELILIKTLDQAGDWQVYSEPTGNGNKLGLNSSAAASSTTRWDSTSPTSSVFTLRDVGLGTGLIAYCFHSVSGYSKFGSYSGSGASGNAQNVGFGPDLVILKSTNATTDWAMFDTVRGAKVLYADLSNAESSDSRVTLTSTGFEFTGSAYNESGRDWIYMAFKIN
jgi:hypothetical protein